MHSPTITLSILILVSILTLIIFAVWRFNSTVAGLRAFFLGFVFAWMNLIYFVIQPNVPNIVSVLFGQLTLLMTGYMVVAGCGQYVGYRRGFNRIVAGLILLGVLLSAFFTLTEAGMRGQFAPGSMLTGVLFAYAGKLLIGGGFKQYPARYLVAGTFIIHGIILVVRPWLLVSPNKQLLFNEFGFGAIQFILVELLVVSVVFAIGIVMLVNEKISHVLRFQAERDSLTNLYNRRAFLDLLGKSRSLSKRLGSSLSLLVLDLDHFKKINDQYGHYCGDEVLKIFAASTTGFLRHEDVVGRIGGEEFAIFLPGTTGDAADAIAERLRHYLTTISVIASAGEIRFTVSIGVACFQAVDSIESVFQRADSALYAAKTAGRNKIARA